MLVMLHPFYALQTDVILFIWKANTIIAVLETDHIINYRDRHIEGLHHHKQQKQISL